MPLKALGSNLFNTFNKHLHSIKLGDLVLVGSNCLLKNHNLNYKQDELVVGIIVSNAISFEEVDDSGHYLESPNIYYKKVYKLFIHDKIVLVKKSDILEKLS